MRLSFMSRCTGCAVPGLFVAPCWFMTDTLSRSPSSSLFPFVAEPANVPDESSLSGSCCARFDSTPPPSSLSLSPPYPFPALFFFSLSSLLPCCRAQDPFLFLNPPPLQERLRGRLRTQGYFCPSVADAAVVLLAPRYPAVIPVPPLPLFAFPLLGARWARAGVRSPPFRLLVAHRYVRRLELCKIGNRKHVGLYIAGRAVGEGGGWTDGWMARQGKTTGTEDAVQDVIASPSPRSLPLSLPPSLPFRSPDHERHCPKASPLVRQDVGKRKGWGAGNGEATVETCDCPRKQRHRKPAAGGTIEEWRIKKRCGGWGRSGAGARKIKRKQGARTRGWFNWQRRILWPKRLPTTERRAIT